MIVASHKAPGERLILNVIDSVLKGKRFEQGTMQLDLSADFFRGEEKTAEEIKNISAKAFSIYFVGEESVALGVKLKLIDEGNIKTVSKIPHAQMIRV